MGEQGRPGGPIRGSGRAPLAPETRRSELLRLMLRRGELADLRAIADQWQVPAATAAWAILHSELRRFRSLCPDLGQPLAQDLGVIASRQVTRRGPKRASAIGETPPQVSPSQKTSRTPDGVQALKDLGV